MTKRRGSVLAAEWKAEEPFFDTSFAHARTKGGGQVGVADPKRVLDGESSQAVHTGPSSSDAVLAVYENAMIVGGLRGSIGIAGVAWVGLLPALGLIGSAILGAEIVWKIGLSDPAMSFGFGMITLLSGFGGVISTSVLLRFLILMPSDFPVIFNRSTRKVWIAVPKMPSFVRIFEVPQTSIECHSWSDLKPRIYRILEVTSGLSSARWTYFLTLVFGQADDPKKVAAELNVGFKGWGDDFELLQLWEHIRQFMNEGGPGLQTGEELKTSGKRRLPVFPQAALRDAGRKLEG